MAKESKGRGFWGTMLSDEKGNISAPRVIALILIVLGMFVFFVGVFMAALGNKDGAAYCVTGYQWAFGTALGNIGFAQVKSALVLGQQQPQPTYLPQPQPSPSPSQPASTQQPIKPGE